MRTYAVKDVCSRCPRVIAEREVTLDEAFEQSEDADPDEIVVSFPQKEASPISFGMLCETCQEFMHGSLMALFQPIDSNSVRRSKKTKKEEEGSSGASTVIEGGGEADGVSIHNAGSSISIPKGLR